MYKHLWCSIHSGLGRECIKCEKYINMDTTKNFSEELEKEDCPFEKEDDLSVVQGKSLVVHKTEYPELGRYRNREFKIQIISEKDDRHFLRYDSPD